MVKIDHKILEKIFARLKNMHMIIVKKRSSECDYLITDHLLIKPVNVK